MQTHILYLTFFSTIVFYFVVKKTTTWLSRRRFARAHGCKPPPWSPPAEKNYPFGIGVLFEILKAADEGRMLEYVRCRYGSKRTLRASALGKSMIATIEPRNVQTILALNFKDFELGEHRNNALGPLLGHGIFASDGETWEQSRALVRPNFVRNQVTDMQVYEEHVMNLIKLIPIDGSTVDLQELFFRMTLDSATEFLFGQSVSSLTPGTIANTNSAQFARNFNQAQDFLAHRMRIGPLLLRWYKNAECDRVVKESRQYVDQFVQKAIERREALNNGTLKDEKDDKTYVFLNKLSERTLDKTTLTDQLLNILLAGRDTTASLLSHTFFVLARRQDVWKKLKEETAPLNGKTPTYEQIKDMKYLSWVMNETLRLYPIVPQNVRMANKDTILPLGGGPDGKSPVLVKKGEDVFYEVYSMHRLPEVYGPDANEYRPERWETLRPGWAYLPFNGGPRVCIGQQFALTEAGYTIVRILQHFSEIESRDDLPWMEALTLTLASKNGTKVALTPV